jgi:hypothetical protein
VANSSTMDNHENLKCLTDLDLSNLKLIDSTNDGFATVVIVTPQVFNYRH